MTDKKNAQTKVSIHPILENRWSPRSFDSRPIEKNKIISLFEAARWSASCYNDQPWNFIIATKEDDEAYQKMLSCLVESNQLWASKAYLLLIAIARKHFNHNGKENHHARHDIGMSLSQLTMQAVSQGLSVHLMAGFDSKRAQTLYAIPDGFDAVVAGAVSYRNENIEDLPENLQEKELAVRERKNLEDFVFQNKWKEVSHLIK